MVTRSALLAISVLILVTLACSPAAQATPTPTKLPTETPEIANTATTTPAPTHTPEMCVVVAVNKLHLRADPDEDATVLDWLSGGEELTKIANSEGWTMVSHDGMLGYVRSIYTTEGKCK